MTLGLVDSGEHCEIVQIRQSRRCGRDAPGYDQADDQRHTTSIRVEEIGLRPGKRVTVLNNDGNLLLLLVDNVRIAIDRRMAMNIMVKGER